MFSIVEHEPKSVYDLYSIPIWFNKTLGTKINIKLKLKGFDFVKDFFPVNKIIDIDYLKQRADLSFYEKHQILSIKSKMPQNWINMVNTQEYIIPLRQLKLKIGSKNLYNCTNHMQYSCFIQSKKLLPIGFEKWCLEYNFNDIELKNIFLMEKTPL